MGKTLELHQPFVSSSSKLSVSKSKPFTPIRQTRGNSTVSWPNRNCAPGLSRRMQLSASLINCRNR